MYNKVKQKFLESTINLGIAPIGSINKVEEEELEEALIGFGGSKPRGEFVMLAGGPGSGKGWTLNNVLLSSGDFKVFDVDRLKTLMIKKLGNMGRGDKIPSFGKSKTEWENFKAETGTDQIDVGNLQHLKYLKAQAKLLKIEKPNILIKFFRDAKKGKFWTNSTWDMKNPSHVSLLHGLIAAKGAYDKYFNNFFDSQSGKPKENKDNIIADVTGDDVEESVDMLSKAKNAGFRTTVVYVLTEQQIAWYNNISRDRKVAKDVFAKKHDDIPKGVRAMLTTSADYIDRAFIVFSEPRGEGKPILDVRDTLPPIDFFKKFMVRKPDETDAQYDDRKGKELKAIKKRENMIQALKNLASAEGLSVREFLKTKAAKGTHTSEDPLSYGDVVELKKDGNNFTLPNEIKSRMFDFIVNPVNFNVADSDAIPSDMDKYKGWDNFLTGNK